MSHRGSVSSGGAGGGGGYMSGYQQHSHSQSPGYQEASTSYLAPKSAQLGRGGTSGTGAAGSGNLNALPSSSDRNQGGAHHAQPHGVSDVPDVPGRLVEEPQLGQLRRHVSDLCGVKHTRFPGAQPVSFDKSSIELLLKEDFWVCEKSDGQRVLILIVINPSIQKQELFLIDRKNEYREVEGFWFPSLNGGPLDQTLLDGELVTDVNPQTGRRALRLLLFDLICLNREDHSSKPLGRRQGILRKTFFDPLARLMQSRPDLVAATPFEIKIKSMDLCYVLDYVLKERIPRLEHGNDGLIFTCLNSGYTMGTDEKILKWKPPSENTIDFKLRLRFPPSANDPSGRIPDLHAKPFFVLEQYVGRGRGPNREDYEYFDFMHVTDEEWESMKASGLQFDDRVVECAWDFDGEEMTAIGGDIPPEREDGSAPSKRIKTDVEAVSRGEARVQRPRWKLKRIRDDKLDGNHSSVVTKVLQSIRDGVEENELLSFAPQFRATWKSAEREALRRAQAASSSSSGRQAPSAGPGHVNGTGSGGGARSRGGPGRPMISGGTVPGLIRR